MGMVMMITLKRMKKVSGEIKVKTLMMTKKEI